MKTIWKPIQIEGWQGYEVSTEGYVRRISDKKELKWDTSITGARRYAVQQNLYRVAMYASQIVAITFIDGAEELLEQGYCARHKNFDTADDRLENIEVVTKSQLVADARQHHKVTVEGNEELIYELWYEGNTPEEIKDELGVPAYEVRKYLAKNKLRYRKYGSQKWHDETYAKIRKLYWEEDLNKSQIMKRLNLPNRHFVDEALDSKIKK